LTIGRLEGNWRHRQARRSRVGSLNVPRLEVTDGQYSRPARSQSAWGFRPTRCLQRTLKGQLMLVRAQSCGRPTLLRRLRCSVSRLDAFPGAILPRRIRSESGKRKRTTSPNRSASRDELNWQSPRSVTSHRAKPRSARLNLIIQQSLRSDARDWCWHFWRFYVRSNPVISSGSDPASSRSQAL
jgi:hypothetical protein